MNRNFAWVVLPTVLIVVSLIAGVFMYLQGVGKQQKQQETVISSLTPTVQQQVSPTPTPVALDISKYTIEVLNGSGISGEAAKTKGLLKKENFIVSSIGNADLSNYQKTIIQARKTVPKEFFDKLKSFLGKLYVLDDIKELDKSEKSDIIIIVGSKNVSE